MSSSMTRLLWLLTLLGLACGAGAVPEGARSSAPTKPTCPNLDSHLDQLAASSDPEAFAARSGLVLRAGRVAVIVETSGPSDLGVYSFVEEARHADQIQGNVPVARLCALAGAPGVRFVRPIDRPEPGGSPARP